MMILEVYKVLCGWFKGFLPSQLSYSFKGNLQNLSKRWIAFIVCGLHVLEGPLLNIAHAGQHQRPLLVCEEEAPASSVSLKRYRAPIGINGKNEYKFRLSEELLAPGIRIQLVDPDTTSSPGFFEIDVENSLTFKGSGSFNIAFPSSLFRFVEMDVDGTLKLHDQISAEQQRYHVTNLFKNKAIILATKALRVISAGGAVHNNGTMWGSGSVTLDGLSFHNKGLLRSDLSFETFLSFPEEAAHKGLDLVNEGEVYLPKNRPDTPIFFKSLENKRTLYTQGGELYVQDYRNTGLIENTLHPLAFHFQESILTTHGGVLTSTSPLYVARGLLNNEGLMKAPSLWIRSLAENKGILVGYASNSLNGYREKEKVDSGTFLLEGGFFAGIYRTFLNTGKILAPFGAIFLGENIKVRDRSATDKSHIDYGGPFTPGEFGFLSKKSSFVNHGEIDTNTSALVIRNVREVMHGTAEEASLRNKSTAIPVFNALLCNPDSKYTAGDLNMEQLPSFIHKDYISAGHFIVESALFSPQKTSLFPSFPEASFGTITLRGDVDLNLQDESLLWLSARNIALQTFLRGGSFYSFLFGGHRTIPRIQNERSLRFQKGAVRGLQNHGTIVFEGDFGTPEALSGVEKHLAAYHYTQASPLKSYIFENTQSLSIRGSMALDSGSADFPLMMLNSGDFRLGGDGDGLHFNGAGKVQIGSEEGGGPSNISLTFTGTMGDLLLCHGGYAQLNFHNIRSYGGQIRSLSPLGIHINNKGFDLTFMGSLLVKGRLDVLDISSDRKTQFVLKKPDQYVRRIADADTFDFSSAIEPGDIVASGRIHFHSRRGFKNETGRLVTSQDVTIGSEAYNGFVRNDSLIMGLRSLSLYADHIFGTGILKTQGLATLMGGDVDISAKNIQSSALQMIASKSLKLPHQGVSTEGDMYLKGPTIYFTAPVGGHNVTAIMNHGHIATHVAARARLYLEAEDHLEQTSEGKLSGREVILKGNNTMSLAGALEARRNAVVQAAHLDLMGTFLKSHATFIDAGELTSKDASIEGEALQLKADRANLQETSFMTRYASFGVGHLRSSGNTHVGDFRSFDIDSFEGGSGAAVDMADSLSQVGGVSLSMKSADYVNSSSRTFHHKNLSLSFGSVKNLGEIKAEGTLKLHGERFFTNKSSIQTNGDLFTTTKGRHYNQGTLESQQGINYSEGAQIMSRGRDEITYASGLHRLFGLGKSRRIRPEYKGKQVIQRAKTGIDHEGADLESDQDILLSTEKGDIRLNPYTHYVKTTYDRLKRYDSSQMKAKGNIVVEASEGGIQAPTLKAAAGKNISFVARDDIDLSSKVETYVAERWRKSGFLWFSSSSGTREAAEFTQTQMGAGGTVNIASKTGGISAQASQFSSATGDVLMAAEGDILLEAIKATLHHREDKSSWWGLCGTSKEGYHQEARVFGAHAKNTIRAHSRGGKVKGEGVQVEADKVSLYGEKGVSINELRLEQAETLKEYGLDLTIFGFNVFRPSRTKGISTSIGLGYSEETQRTSASRGVHSTIKANTLEVGTGKAEGTAADLRGTDIPGGPNGKTDLVMDTPELKVGGSTQEATQTSDAFNIGVGFDLASMLPEAEGGFSTQRRTQRTYQKAKLAFGTVTNRHAGAKVDVSRGAEMEIASSKGEAIDLHVDHAQSTESQEGVHANIGIGAKKVQFGVGANWGEKKTSEGLTNVVLGPDTQSISREDTHHEDTDTRAGFGVNVGISEKGVDVSVSVQVRDHSFGFSTAMISDLQSLTENFGNLSNVSLPTNLTELLDITDSLLKTSRQTQTFLEGMGVELPEEIRVVLDTAEKVSGITRFVDTNVLDKTLWEGIRDYKLPETFDGFLSDGKEALNFMGDFLSKAEEAGIPVPQELRDIIQKSKTLVSASQELSQKFQAFDLESLSSQLEGASFGDLLKGSHEFIAAGKKIQTFLEHMQIDVPKEWTTFLDQAEQVVSKTDTFYTTISQNAFLRSLTSGGKLQLPQTVREGIDGAESILEAASQTTDFLRSLEIEVPQGVQSTLNAAKQATGIARFVDTNVLDKSLWKGIRDYKLPETFDGFLSDGKQALTFMEDFLSKAEDGGLPVPPSLKGMVQKSATLVGASQELVKEFQALDLKVLPTKFKGASFGDLLKGGQEFLAVGRKIQSFLEEAQVDVPKEWIAVLSQAEEVVSKTGTLYTNLSQNAFLKSLASGGKLNLPQTLNEGIDGAESILEATSQTSDFLKGFGVEIPGGVSQFLETSHRVVDLTSKIEKHIDLEEIREAFGSFHIPESLSDVASQALRAVSGISQKLEALEGEGISIPTEIKDGLGTASSFLGGAQQLADLIGKAGESRPVAIKDFSELLSHGSSFIKTAQTIQEGLEKMGVPVPEDWGSILTQAESVIGAAESLHRGFHQEALLKALQEKPLPSFLKASFSADHIPSLVDDTIETASFLLNKIDHTRDLLGSFGIQVPEKVSSFVSTAKRVVHLSESIYADVSEAYLLDGWQHFELSPTLTGFVSGGQETLATLTDALAKHQDILPPRISQALNQATDIFGGISHLASFIEGGLSQERPEGSLKTGFSDIISYAGDLLDTCHLLQEDLEKLSIPLPKEWEAVLAGAHQVFDLTEFLKQKIFQEAFLTTVGSSSLPNLIESVVDQAQTFLGQTNLEVFLGEEDVRRFQSFLSKQGEIKKAFTLFKQAETLVEKLHLLATNTSLQTGLSQLPLIQNTLLENLSHLKAQLPADEVEILEGILEATPTLISQAALLQERLRDLQFAQENLLGNGRMMETLFEESLAIGETFLGTVRNLEKFQIKSPKQMEAFIGKARGTIDVLAQAYGATQRNSPKTILEALMALGSSVSVWRAVGVDTPPSIQTFLEEQKEVQDLLASFQSIMPVQSSSFTIEYPAEWDRWMETLGESFQTLEDITHLFGTFQIDLPQEGQSFMGHMRQALHIIQNTEKTAA